MCRGEEIDSVWGGGGGQERRLIPPYASSLSIQEEAGGHLGPHSEILSQKGKESKIEGGRRGGEREKSRLGLGHRI